MKSTEIRWNDEARAKIVDDADGVLRDAVLELSATMADASSDEVYAELNSRLKDRFIDYKPGPDIRLFADAIAAGDIDGNE